MLKQLTDVDKANLRQTREVLLGLFHLLRRIEQDGRLTAEKYEELEKSMTAVFMGLASTISTFDLDK